MKSKSMVHPQVTAIMLCLAMTLAGVASGQTATNSAAPSQTLVRPGLNQATRQATEADHLRMMDLLNIKSLRRGRDGNNTNSPFYANYDDILNSRTYSTTART